MVAAAPAPTRSWTNDGQTGSNRITYGFVLADHPPETWSIPDHVPVLGPAKEH